MSGNANLKKAKAAKQDEFYTQLSDIENELKHYKNQFKDKTVLCNCDDPYESNFFKYFALNFNSLKLKKLICTCYDGSPVSGEQLSLFDIDELDDPKEKKGYKVELNSVVDYNKDGQIDLRDVEQILKRRKSALTVLNGDGDFRSPECLKLLKEADIVVTNPPFSLFREYISLLEEYNKKFLIIGNINNVTYREVFPYIKDNKFWLGNKTGGMEFRVPDDFEQDNTYINSLGIKMAKFGNICWYTNLDLKKRHEDLILTDSYENNKSKYPKYINYDGIDCGKVNNIPCDYYGVIGVPVTFLQSYNPEQFEILGIDGGDMGSSYGVSSNLTPEQCKELFKEHKGFRKGKLCYRDENNKLQVCYRRILIRRKKI